MSSGHINSFPASLAVNTKLFQSDDNVSVTANVCLNSDTKS